MGNIRHFGLIGHPISHSQSPALFYGNHPGTADRYDLIETPDIDEAISIFKRDFDAINVTAPFKERAMLAADTLEKECELCGATNLLKKVNGGIRGYNTDIDGVYRTIAAHSGEAQYGRSALIIGCGGAGKAAAIAMANKYRSRFKIVTLDGQVMNPGGSMTGGSVNKEAGILSRANELEKLTKREQELTAAKQQREQEMKEAQRAVDEVEYQLTAARDRLREAEDQVLLLQGQQKQYEILLNAVEEAARSAQREQQTISSSAVLSASAFSSALALRTAKGLPTRYI